MELMEVLMLLLYLVFVSIVDRLLMIVVGLSMVLLVLRFEIV